MNEDRFRDRKIRALDDPEGKILPSPVVDDNVPTPFPDTTVLCDGSLEPVGTAPALRGSCPADRADGDGPDMKSKLRGEFKCGTSRALVPEGKRPPVKSLKFSKSFNGYSVGDQKDEGRKEWPLLKYWKKIEAKNSTPQIQKEVTRLRRKLMLYFRQRASQKNRSKNFLRRRSASTDSRDSPRNLDLTAHTGNLPENHSLMIIDEGSVSDPGEIETSYKLKPLRIAEKAPYKPAEGDAKPAPPKASGKGCRGAEAGRTKEEKRPTWGEVYNAPGARASESETIRKEEKKLVKKKAVMLRIRLKVQPSIIAGVTEEMKTAAFSHSMMSFAEGDTGNTIVKKIIYKHRMFATQEQQLWDGSVEYGLLVCVEGCKPFWIDNTQTLKEAKIANQTHVFCLPRKQIIRVRFHRWNKMVQTFIVESNVTPKELVKLLNHRAKLGLQPECLKNFRLRFVTPNSSRTQSVSEADPSAGELSSDDWLQHDTPLYLQSTWSSIMHMTYALRYPLHHTQLNGVYCPALVVVSFQQVVKMREAGHLVRLTASNRERGTRFTRLQSEEVVMDLEALEVYVKGYSEEMHSHSYKGLTDPVAWRLHSLKASKVSRLKAMGDYMRLIRGLPVKFPRDHRRDARIVCFPPLDTGLGFDEHLKVAKIDKNSPGCMRGVDLGWKVVRVGDIWVSSRSILDQLMKAAKMQQRAFQLLFIVPAASHQKVISQMPRKSQLFRGSKIPSTRVGLALILRGWNLRPSLNSPQGVDPDPFLIIRAGESGKILHQTVTATVISNVQWNWESIFLPWHRFDADPLPTTNLRIECWDYFGLIGISSARICDLLERKSVIESESENPRNSGSGSCRSKKNPSATDGKGGVVGRVKLPLKRSLETEGGVEISGSLDIATARIEGDDDFLSLTPFPHTAVLPPKPSQVPTVSQNNKSDSAPSLQIDTKKIYVFSALDPSSADPNLVVKIHPPTRKAEISSRPKRPNAEAVAAMMGMGAGASRVMAARRLGESHGIHKLQILFQGGSGGVEEKVVGFKTLGALYRCQQTLTLATFQISTQPKPSPTDRRRRHGRKWIGNALKTNLMQPGAKASSAEAPDVTQISLLCATYNMANKKLYRVLDAKDSKEHKDGNKDKGSKKDKKVKNISQLPHAKPPTVPEGILKEGSLEKRGYIVEAFRTRHFAVKWSPGVSCFELRYYKTDKLGAKIGGTITLRNSVVDGGEDDDGLQFQLLTAKRQWTFRALSPDLRRKWVKSLRWYLRHPTEPDEKHGERSGAERQPFHWLTRGYDLYAIALQECKYAHRRGFSSCEEDVSFCLVSHLGRTKYHVIKAVSMGEIRIIIVARRGLSVHGVRVGHVATGVAGVLRNKGGVGVSLWLQDTRLCFVGAHLAARPYRVRERNSNAHIIMRDLSQTLAGGRSQMNDISSPKRERGLSRRIVRQENELTFCHSHVFFFGDLNYRIVGIPRSKVLELIDCNKLKRLQLFEQLQKEKNRGRVLAGYREQDIDFKPTYRYCLETNEWSKFKLRNFPSWTDRILYKAARPDAVRVLRYWMDDTARGSDHRPVLCSFSIRCHKVVPSIEIVSQRLSDPSVSSPGSEAWWRSEGLAQVTLYEAKLDQAHPKLGRHVSITISSDLLAGGGSLTVASSGTHPRPLTYSPRPSQRRNISSPSSENDRKIQLERLTEGDLKANLQQGPGQSGRAQTRPSTSHRQSSSAGHMPMRGHTDSHSLIRGPASDKVSKLPLVAKDLAEEDDGDSDVEEGAEIGTSMYTNQFKMPQILILRFEKNMRCLLARQDLRVSVRALDRGGNYTGGTAVLPIPVTINGQSEPKPFSTTVAFHGRYRAQLTGYIAFEWL